MPELGFNTLLALKLWDRGPGGGSPVKKIEVSNVKRERGIPERKN